MIFVSIACYKDPDVVNTIESLVQNADNPLSIYVFNQSDTPLDHPFATVINVDHKKTKGPSWARHVLQSFITDEKYYMQIDAHMRVCKGWDTKMIKYLEEANSKKPILTFYPPGFIGDHRDNVVQRNIVRGVGSGAVSSIAEPCNRNKSYTIAAGFIFAPIEFALEVPIDPQIYWNYEETDLTLRAYTNGWDFFSTPEPIIWHRYNLSGVVPVTDNWVGLENFSNDHARKKYLDPNYKTRYGLGNARTLQSFETLTDINIERREMYRSRKKLLIVVPYRDRDKHLEVYLANVPKYFENISHDILLCELDPGCEWNAGMTANSMINFRDDYEYVYISHVDVFPTGEWEWPGSGEFFSDMGDAGSCLLRYDDFIKVGGYGNNFWGWGAEDDNLYMKLNVMGVKRKRPTTQFNVDMQGHERKFNGKNYTHNLRELKKPFDFKAIHSVNKVSITHSLKRLAPNIYKQNVTSTVKAEPNRKALLGYIKGITDFKVVAPWVKSGMYYGNDYDVVMFCVGCTIKDELRAFGVNVIDRVMEIEDLFFDRFKAYASIASDYDQVLHVDVTDAYFLDNPFNHIKDPLVVVSEGVKFKDCEWNTNAMKAVYGDTYIEEEVVCGGVIGGDSKEFIDLCNKIVASYTGTKMHGADQPVLNKLLYGGEVKCAIYREELAAHLHHHFTGKNIIGLDGITAPGYAIVHQFNRDHSLYNRVLDYFSKFFAIDQMR